MYGVFRSMHLETLVPVKDGLSLILMLWLALTPFSGNATGASAPVAASASVVLPANANTAIQEFWSTNFISHAIAGRLIIRLPRLDRYAEASAIDANEIGDPAVFSSTGFAHVTLTDFIKRIVGNEVLRSGDVISALTVDVMSVTGVAIVTVAYN